MEISCVNWPQYPGRNVRVSVTLGKDRCGFSAFFTVSEPEILARFTQPGQPVYRDSCVELFIMFDQSGYFNIECNPLGTLLCQFGSSRHDRTNLAPDLVSRITARAEIDSVRSEWKCRLYVPWSVCEAFVPDARNCRAKGNCYKCGNDLAAPHYFSLFPVKTAEPDFHQPGFFEYLPITEKEKHE